MMATKKRNDFNKSIIDVLAKRAAYICSNPDCKTMTIAPSPKDTSKFIYIGKAAHITAASKGGPRFDSDMNPDKRKSIDNGIFLCSNCADMVDKNKGMDFSVDLLQKWKSAHGSWVSNNLNKKIHKQAKQIQIFNTTSTNQSGGITAGIVNVESPKRKLNGGLIKELLNMLPDKAKTITIVCVMGDGEAFNFATQIKLFLINKGYSVNGVNQSIFSAPVMGQQFDKNTLTITIGTKI